MEVAVGLGGEGGSDSHKSSFGLHDRHSLSITKTEDMYAGSRSTAGASVNFVKDPDSGLLDPITRHCVISFDSVRFAETLLHALRPLSEHPGGVFEQVGHLDALLKAGGITLESAIQVLQDLRINPWSLLGGYGTWAEVQRDWALQLGMPRPWIAVLGPRTRSKGNDPTYNPVENAFRIPVDLDLEHLPPDLKVKNLEIRHCPRLLELGPGLAVQENLCLHGCGLLERLPEDLEVGGRLSITSCSSLQEVRLGASPTAVLLKDDFDLRAIHLPAGFEGNLGVESCMRFDSLTLPSGTLENLYLNGTGRMALLPVARVRGGLYLDFQCFGSLPDGLQVDGAASFQAIQSNSISIPAGLCIGSHLILDVPLADRVEIPSDVQVKGAVYLTEAPPWGRELLAPDHLQVKTYSEFSELPALDIWAME
jgi:hypothetical protein